MSEQRGADEPSLTKLLGKLDPVDLVLVEGYKREGHDKIEAHREATGQSLIAPRDVTIVAVASDTEPEASVPVLDLDDTTGIADFILASVGLVRMT